MMARRNWTLDLLSGFSVFLIALPLSVGIALASGAPATAGILAAIVGGVLGGFLGGSYLTINGPAAGLIVIVLGAVQDLGMGDAALGYRRMLATAVVAGLFQMVFGCLRLGILGTAVPGSVIYGMMTSIGVIIVAKQAHIALGIVPTSKETLSLIAEVPNSLRHMNPQVALIAVLGGLILVHYKSFAEKVSRFVPAPLLVLVMGISLANYFGFPKENLMASHFESLKDSSIIFPDFSVIGSLTSIRYVVSLSLVASIESLLTAAALDRMDPYKRRSNLDRELLSKGFCNAVSGLIGGLPIIAEIVRSSANVRNGAQTRLACIFHGVFVLAFLVFLPSLLAPIPLGALAAILISVGFALARPSQVVQVGRIGRDHLVSFLVTLSFTLASDLLVGVLAGILTEAIFNFVHGASLKDLFYLRVEEDHEPKVTLRVQSALLFTNYWALRRRLLSLSGKEVLVDLTGATVVDHTAIEKLSHAHEERGGEKLVLAFAEDQIPLSTHPFSKRRRLRKKIILR